MLYWWPDDGLKRGTVARLSGCHPSRLTFSVSPVVAYTRHTSALHGTADTLQLDAAS